MIGGSRLRVSLGSNWAFRLLLAGLAVSCSSGNSEKKPAENACPAGYADCGGQCLDLASNAQSCGACGVACSPGQLCTGGACECQAGLTSCGAQCANLQGDGTNCGACGTACAADQVCASGVCSSEGCPDGQLQCGTSCVESDTDPLNCGACGTACAAPMTCAGGACVCPAGSSNCGGQCVNTSSDLNNCGACGTPCTGGATCANGTCVGGTGGSGTGGGGNGGAGTGGAGTGGVSTGGVSTGGGGTGGTLVHPTCPGETANAYQGQPGQVPGTVEAEDFDTNGYSDSSAANEGGAYRTDVEVDIKALGGGYAIGWMTAGEWVEYTVNVPAAGDYTLSVQTGAVDAGRTLEFTECGTALASVAVPQIGAWGEMATVTAGTVHLEAGLQVIRVTVGANDYVDFDSFTLTEGSAGTGGAGTGGAPTGGAPTGGVATGGVATGGAPTGGAPPVGKFVGNITTGNNQVDTNGRTYSTYWNQITPENAGKWGSVQSSALSGSFNWGGLDAIYDYTQTHGIIFKQHTFVWGPQQPNDAASITETHVRRWMQEFCARYPATALIDVVNEPPPHTTPAYANAIGGGTNGSWQWIINAFEWADEYCPNAILILNDYNNIEWGDQTDHFISIANAVKNAGAPIDAIGAQAHGLSGQTSSNNMRTLLTRMHDQTGLPVYITEYDIDQADDQTQLARYQDQFPFFYETEWIHGITIWGWIHGSTWVPDSGLIRNGTPRPAMTWLMDYLDRPAP